MICVTVTHQEPDAPDSVRADVYRVDLYGQVSDMPVRTYEIAPGGTAMVHLQDNNVLVVRELTHARDAEPGDDSAEGA